MSPHRPARDVPPDPRVPEADDHQVDASLGLCRVRDLGHEETVGARVEQPLRWLPLRSGTRTRAAMSIDCATTIALVGEVERERAVLHVDDDELEAGHAASSSSVSRLGSFTHVPNVVGPGRRNPSGTASRHRVLVGVQHPARPLGEVDPRGQKMSISWWRISFMLWLVCIVGGGMMVMAGLVAEWCSSSRQSSMSTVQGVRMWCT